MLSVMKGIKNCFKSLFKYEVRLVCLDPSALITGWEFYSLSAGSVLVHHDLMESVVKIGHIFQILPLINDILKCIGDKP